MYVKNNIVNFCGYLFTFLHDCDKFTCIKVIYVYIYIYQLGAEAFGALTDTAKRSINLALSFRGIQALKDQGLYVIKSYNLMRKSKILIYFTDEFCKQYVMGT